MLTSTSIKAANRGYWDPSESMLTYARTKDANATQDNYFQIVSSRRLGQTQTAQFQSGNQYGANWIWGSKCTADNVCDESNPYKSSALAAIPRSYYFGNNTFGALYTQYAATAESASYPTLAPKTYQDASDSICPKGWQLPEYSTIAASKSWYSLFDDAYKLHTQQYDASDGALTVAESEEIIRKSPFSLSYSKNYQWSTGSLASDIGLFWISSNRSTMDTPPAYRVGSSFAFSTTLFLPGNESYPEDGLAIRCVKR